MKFILLINVKMPTSVGILHGGILTFISRIYKWLLLFVNLKFPLIFAISVFMSSLNFMLNSCVGYVKVL